MRVGNVPGADHLARVRSDLHSAGAGDQAEQHVVVTEAAGSVFAGGGGAVDDPAAHSLRDRALQERVDGDGLAATGRADRQRDVPRVEAVEWVESFERAAWVRESEDQTVRRSARPGGERQAVGDVAVRVAAGRAQRVKPERDRRGQSGQAQPASAHDSRAGVRLEFPGRRS